jgi:hypothetical protein
MAHEPISIFLDAWGVLYASCVMIVAAKAMNDARGE